MQISQLSHGTPPPLRNLDSQAKRLQRLKGCVGVERSGPSPTEEERLGCEDSRTDGHSLIYGRILKNNASHYSWRPTSADQPHFFSGNFVNKSTVYGFRNKRLGDE
ncbi:hypothetical protein AMECASPLE_010121 [Ameca splendens]|uniref:Uncharacterized protein n=1 Tax=Ameca splendens TaxID=208324 RepID=A0ABV0YNT2_9TELE